MFLIVHRAIHLLIHLFNLGISYELLDLLIFGLLMDAFQAILLVGMRSCLLAHLNRRAESFQKHQLLLFYTDLVDLLL
jgi:hypothetical protein